MVILKIGQDESSGKTSMDGSVLVALMLINRASFVIFVSRSTLTPEIMLILTEKNGSNVKIVINGFILIVKSKMVLLTSENNCKMRNQDSSISALLAGRRRKYLLKIALKEVQKENPRKYQLKMIFRTILLRNA